MARHLDSPLSVKITPPYSHVMNQRLNEAASSGDIDSLYSIIQEDPYILNRIDEVPFVDTPLHISTSSGHIHFSLEIMRLKPSFAKKLNPKGYSPLHLALQNDQTDTVFRLIDIDRDLVSIQGREGFTPLHLAAFGGKADILTKFFISCPTSIKELTIHKETALHIAVKSRDIESLKILLEWTEEACMSKLLNWADDEGNNIMHLAALTNQMEMVKLLVKKVEMKAKNLEGLTALDMLKNEGCLEDNELKKMLRHARILKEPRILLPTLTDLSNILRWTLLFLKRLVISDHREITYMSKEDRNAILVVSVLIATATYQALLANKDLQDNLTDATLLSDYGAYKIILFACFIFLNSIAFVASMIEICVHLPSGIGYTLHLVLPLVICYVLLLLLCWPQFYTLQVIVTLAFILSKIPMVRQKLNQDHKAKKLIKLHSFVRRNPRLERKLSEMSHIAMP